MARVGLAETDLGPTHATIARPRGAGPSSLGPLPRLDLIDATHADGELIARGELGRGGMGVVHLADQRSLGREVAVKVARSGEPEALRALVREARVMGALEHPSLVPVHALGLSADGAPLLVMKRIEGVAWRELLRAADHPAWANLLIGHGDRLRAHVDILSQLCRALAFAHAHGVVHRDLKPENVMIGRFGEVVLLDWGVALRLSERADEPEGIVGTPGYLAPEMVRADPTLVDARTDVYLLGATLYEILSGRMPHEAPSALAALASALVGDVSPLPDTAPAELSALVMRAMMTERDARLPSAEAFREGLAHFLASRDADALAAEASAALERARAAIVKDGATSADGLRALVEARFGLASALRMRPGDVAIRRTLDEAVRAMIEREIALRSAASARGLLAELSSADLAIEARIAALDRAIEIERADATARDTARREAASQAAVRPLMITILCLWASGQSLGWWFFWHREDTAGGFPVRTAIALDLIAVVLAALLMWSFRRRLFATAGTRRLTMTYSAWGWSLVLSDLVSYSMGATVAEAGAHSMFASACVTALAAVEMPLLWLSAAGHAIAIPLIETSPSLSTAIVMTTMMFDLVWFFLAFRRHAARTAVTGS